mmetsp:Transcript_125524/g.363211  ORF Transcript_125524/g.363211 Transcript_125524/m.363211 type:complete len:111 (-) Transcript_125524:128-460(-)
MMGPPYLAAASMQALMELVPTTLTPGIANPTSLAWSRRSTKAFPVTTPGLTEAGSLAKALFSVEASVLFKKVAGRLKEAPGVKAAAGARRRKAVESFMVVNSERFLLTNM